MPTQHELASKLAESIERHDIPGAQLALIDGEQLVEASAGVLSTRTGLAVTNDSLFLPGSIGKLYTATLAMMLVDDGKLDLDRPIRDVLPDFRVLDDGAAAVVTARHLLSHTSGFDGDRFTDTGRGDDALARYVAGCADLPQIAAPGTLWSYSNSGYSILGRMVEVLERKVFEDVLRERIVEPLGLQHTVSFAEEAMLHPTAVGHAHDASDPPRRVVARPWALGRAFGPMGSAVVASAGDVLRFVRMHLDGGVAPDGRRLLSAASVAAMQAQQVRLVDDVIGSAWGLGWVVDDWSGLTLIGHDGNSIGQNAFMRVAPAERFGFCLQTNVESALVLYREIAAWLFGERHGVGPRADDVALDDLAVAAAERYAGVYEREGLRLAVRADADGRLLTTVHPTHAIAASQDWPPMVDLPLRPVGVPDRFLLRLPIADVDLPAVFFAPDDAGGRPTYLHFGGRAKRRVA